VRTLKTEVGAVVRYRISPYFICCAPLHMKNTGSSEQLNTLLKYGIDLGKNFELSENI
jgi:hypothetical protein